ncbi:acetyltransferase (GNAT) family protein [Propionicimonas paludicola]|uniref:Acetyltransferase (GNAT) family protein n=1 Tax=Propionicimonas paludicola TaxID=185243 RepID=A0A2A9CV22_9ACTN|nr:GNAT family N-acetyltransferase [Propionicimonas paludicola]PFG17470.1 acetyltransferase (GNAT) family protein [Propionicimonas paludicola]
MIETGIKKADTRELAELHRRAFPTFFLSSLGVGFLEQFYRGFVGDPTAAVVVARNKHGRIVGAVVGTTRPERFFRRLLLRRLFPFMMVSALAVLRRPSIAGRLFAAVRYRGDGPAQSEGGLLSSICVDPDLRGGGIGRSLLAVWELEAKSRGASVAFLTTDAVDNEAVNQFYLRCGWELLDDFVTSRGRRMNRYCRRLSEVNDRDAARTMR